MRNKYLKITMIAVAVLFGAASARAITGSWQGKLKVGPSELPLVFNFTEGEGGALLCTLDSPAQGAKGIPATVVYHANDSIVVMCSSIGAWYGGRVSARDIKGTFRQSGYTFPLTLQPQESDEARRPQTPQGPFPYETIDTAFTAPDGTVLSATLTLPMQASSAKVPAVVMVTGSGPQNRDEENFDHKPFAVIADYLARKGIASLRYDDRGVGRSGGDFAAATTYTFKDDAIAAANLLRGVDMVGFVGIMGHSEGGTIAFMAAAEGKADFVVSLAGMAVSGKETILAQNALQLDKAGVSPQQKDAVMRLLDAVFSEIAAQYSRGESCPVNVDSIAGELGITVDAATLASLKDNRLRTKWMDAFLALDIRGLLPKVKCPVLALNGDKDRQVSVDNLTVIEEFVPGARIQLLPGLNHLMQECMTGGVEEYSEIRQTISPQVLELIADFIARQ